MSTVSTYKTDDKRTKNESDTMPHTGTLASKDMVRRLRINEKLSGYKQLDDNFKEINEN